MSYRISQNGKLYARRRSRDEAGRVAKEILLSPPVVRRLQRPTTACALALRFLLRRKPISKYSESWLWQNLLGRAKTSARVKNSSLGNSEHSEGVQFSVFLNSKKEKVFIL